LSIWQELFLIKLVFFVPDLLLKVLYQLICIPEKSQKILKKRVKTSDFGAKMNAWGRENGMKELNAKQLCEDLRKA